MGFGGRRELSYHETSILEGIRHSRRARLEVVDLPGGSIFWRHFPIQQGPCTVPHMQVRNKGLLVACCMERDFLEQLKSTDM